MPADLPPQDPLVICPAEAPGVAEAFSVPDDLGGAAIAAAPAPPDTDGDGPGIRAKVRRLVDDNIRFWGDLQVGRGQFYCVSCNYGMLALEDDGNSPVDGFAEIASFEGAMKSHLTVDHQKQWSCSADYKVIYVQPFLKTSRRGKGEGNKKSKTSVRVNGPLQVSEGSGTQLQPPLVGPGSTGELAPRPTTTVFATSGPGVDDAFTYASAMDLDGGLLEGVDVGRLTSLTSSDVQEWEPEVVKRLSDNFHLWESRTIAWTVLMDKDTKREMERVCCRYGARGARGKAAFPAQDRTLFAYLRVWKRACLYLVRRYLIDNDMFVDGGVGHLPRILWDVDVPPQVTEAVRGVSSFNRVTVAGALLAIIQFVQGGRCEQGDFGNAASEDGADVEILREATWEMLLLQLSLAMSEGVITSSKFACPLVSAAGALCVDARGIRHPTLASKDMSALIACAKASFVSWGCWESLWGGALLDTARVMDVCWPSHIRPVLSWFTQRDAAYAMESGFFVPRTALACLYDFRNIAMEACYSTPGLTVTSLKDNGYTVTHGANIELNILDIRSGLHGLVADLHRRLVSLLLIPDGVEDADGSGVGTRFSTWQDHIDGYFPHPDIRDDFENRDVGASAYTQTFPGHGAGAQLFGRLAVEPHASAWTDRRRGLLALRDEAVARYFDDAHAFLGDMLVAVFLLLGMQCRGTEFLTVRHTNTVANGRRNLFWDEDYSSWVVNIRYHKTDHGTADTRSTWHLLPPPLAYVVTYYLFYVLPFVQSLHESRARDLGVGSLEQHSEFLCMKGPEQQQSGAFAKRLRALMVHLTPQEVTEELRAGNEAAARELTGVDVDDGLDDGRSADKIDVEPAGDGADEEEDGEEEEEEGNRAVGKNNAAAAATTAEAELCKQLGRLYKSMRGRLESRVGVEYCNVLAAGLDLDDGGWTTTTAAGKQLHALRPSGNSPGAWSPKMFYVQFSRFFLGLGVKMGLADWRHMAEIWGRHISVLLDLDRATVPAFEGHEESFLSVVHQMAGHSDSTAAAKYAVDSTGGVSLMDVKTRMLHCRASVLLHEWFGGDEMLRRPATPSILKRHPARALDDAVPLGGCLQHLERLRMTRTTTQIARMVAADRHVAKHPELVLQALQGSGQVGFKPGQEEALRFAHAGRPLSVVVLPTGAGKTVITFAAARLKTSGVTLLIVPFLSTMEDMCRRAEAAGIVAVTSAQLSKGSRCSAGVPMFTSRTRLIIAVPESFREGPVGAIISDLISSNQLDMAVFDEYHCLFDTMIRRWRLAFYAILHRLARVPRWVVLTATLPPSLEHLVVNTFRSARAGVYERVEDMLDAVLSSDRLLPYDDGRGDPGLPDIVFRRPTERLDLTYRVVRYRKEQLLPRLEEAIGEPHDIHTRHLRRPRKMLIVLALDVHESKKVAEHFGEPLICASHNYDKDPEGRKRADDALARWRSAPNAWTPVGPGEPPMTDATKCVVLFATSIMGTGVDTDANVAVMVGSLGMCDIVQALGRANRIGKRGTAVYFAPQGDGTDDGPELFPASGGSGEREWYGKARLPGDFAVGSRVARDDFVRTTRCRRVALARYFDKHVRRTECSRDADEALCDLCEERAVIADAYDGGWEDSVVAGVGGGSSIADDTAATTSSRSDRQRSAASTRPSTTPPMSDDGRHGLWKSPRATMTLRKPAEPHRRHKTGGVLCPSNTRDDVDAYVTAGGIRAGVVKRARPSGPDGRWNKRLCLGAARSGLAKVGGGDDDDDDDDDEDDDDNEEEEEEEVTIIDLAKVPPVKHRGRILELDSTRSWRDTPLPLGRPQDLRRAKQTGANGTVRRIRYNGQDDQGPLAVAPASGDIFAMLRTHRVKMAELLGSACVVCKVMDGHGDVDHDSTQCPKTREMRFGSVGATPGRADQQTLGRMIGDTGRMAKSKDVKAPIGCCWACFRVQPKDKYNTEAFGCRGKKGVVQWPCDERGENVQGFDAVIGKGLSRLLVAWVALLVTRPWSASQEALRRLDATDDIIGKLRRNNWWINRDVGQWAVESVATGWSSNRKQEVRTWMSREMGFYPSDWKDAFGLTRMGLFVSELL
ncbi:hypothetical protein COL154_013566 [Colletotrichum chrysophilum]|nr:hypothetical protein COL154_013566 [Colletotrichum chrysophilum]